MNPFLKFCICLVVIGALLDIPLSRVHYWLRMTFDISPLKREQLRWLAKTGGHCNVTADKAVGAFANCSAFCAKAKEIVAKRQALLQHVRAKHPAGGGPGGFIFDLDRGAFFQSSKVKDILSRPCQRVVQRADHLNGAANWLAVQSLLVGVGILVWIGLRLRAGSAPRVKEE